MQAASTGLHLVLLEGWHAQTLSVVESARHAYQHTVKVIPWLLSDNKTQQTQLVNAADAVATNSLSLMVGCCM